MATNVASLVLKIVGFTITFSIVSDFDESEFIRYRSSCEDIPESSDAGIDSI